AVVSATEMEDNPKIESRQTIVTAKSKAWHVVTTVSSWKSAPIAKRILGVTARFRPRVGCEKIEARKPLLDFDLKAVIGTVSLGRDITGTSCEIFKWFE